MSEPTSRQITSHPISEGSMIHKDSWSWTRRTFMKSSIAGALLAGYKLLWPSVAQSGSLPAPPQHSSQEGLHNVETDPFGVAGLGERGMRKSRFGFELCPGHNRPNSEP